MSIVACLCFRPMRYSELLKEAKGISGKMLSRELKDLEMNELIESHVLNTAPVAVEYRITDYGESLKQLTNTIADRGLTHRQRIIPGMKKDRDSSIGQVCEGQKSPLLSNIYSASDAPSLVSFYKFKGVADGLLPMTSLQQK